MQLMLLLLLSIDFALKQQQVGGEVKCRGSAGAVQSANVQMH